MADGWLWRPAIGLGIIGPVLAAAGPVAGLMTALLGTNPGGVVLGGIAAIVNNSQVDRDPHR